MNYNFKIQFDIITTLTVENIQVTFGSIIIKQKYSSQRKNLQHKTKIIKLKILQRKH